MNTKRALVTGSAGGIGAATAAALAEAGHEVVGVDVLNDDSRLCYDLSSWQECLALCRRAGPIDILVNNAAVLIEKPATEFSELEFERTVNVNLRAPFLLCRELSAGMRERGFGRIINVSSVGARTGGMSASAVYASTKAGLLSLTKHFARALGGDGVTVNAVAPGAIDTPMSAAQRGRDPNLEANLRELIPVGRWGKADEVASVIVFLASEAASFVNGVTIDVNGGWVMI